jgi:hypothetical protein
MPTRMTPEPERKTVVECGPPDREIKLKPKSPVHAWWAKVKPAPGRVAHKVAEPILRVGHQGLERARTAGRVAANKVIGLQRGVGLPERQVAKTTRGTLERPMGRASDRAWQLGFAQAAEKAVPHLFQPVLDHSTAEVADRELG